MSAADPFCVAVDLGDRSYDILIGQNLIAQAGKMIAARSSARKFGIVTDSNVAPLYLDTLTQSLDAAGLSYSTQTLDPGEGSKSFESFQQLSEAFLEAGLGRGDALIALGGGVVGDVTGFVASSFKRGCGFIQIPTTLLAQVDSSVGGKTAINTRFGKNLVGSFYQPDLVLADLDVLRSLPERQIKAGYAEIIKYGWLGDTEFTAWLEDNGQGVLALSPDALRHAVAQSCRNKADIVSADERERGQRALLNLGHTFAHALEARAGYDGALLHGEAVAIGMQMAFDYSAARGLCPNQDAQRVRTHIRALGLPQFSDLPPAISGDPDALLAPMWQDKKNEGGQLTLILTRGIGQAFVSRGEDSTDLLAFLRDYCQKQGQNA